MYSSNVNGAVSTLPQSQGGAQSSGTLTIDERIMEQIRSQVRHWVAAGAPVTLIITVRSDGALQDVQFSGLKADSAQQLRLYLDHHRFYSITGRLSAAQSRTIALN